MRYYFPYFTHEEAETQRSFITCKEVLDLGFKPSLTLSNYPNSTKDRYLPWFCLLSYIVNILDFNAFYDFSKHRYNGHQIVFNAHIFYIIQHIGTFPQKAQTERAWSDC